MEQNYSLIIESAKFIFLLTFLCGILFGWCMKEFDTFISWFLNKIIFVFKLILKKIRIFLDLKVR